MENLHINEIANFDLLLTDAYLVYAAHLYNGKVCPENIDPDWHAACKETEIDYPDYLAETLINGNIPESLEALKPKNPAYTKLKLALKHYRQLESGDKTKNLINRKLYFEGYQTLELDQIVDRLVVSGDLPCQMDQTTPENEMIAKALINFKKDTD